VVEGGGGEGETSPEDGDADGGDGGGGSSRSLIHVMALDPKDKNKIISIRELVGEMHADTWNTVTTTTATTTTTTTTTPSPPPSPPPLTSFLLSPYIIGDQACRYSLWYHRLG